MSIRRHFLILFLAFAGLASLLAQSGFAQGNDPFWYPSPGGFVQEYQYIPQTQYVPQTYPLIQHSPYQAPPAHYSQGQIIWPAQPSTYTPQHYPTPAQHAIPNVQTHPHFPTPPSVQANPGTAPGAPNLDQPAVPTVPTAPDKNAPSDPAEMLSPSDLSIEEIERQAQSSKKSLPTTEEEIQRLEQMIDANNQEVNDKLERMQQSIHESNQQLQDQMMKLQDIMQNSSSKSEAEHNRRQKTEVELYEMHKAGAREREEHARHKVMLSRELEHMQNQLEKVLAEKADLEHAFHEQMARLEAEVQKSHERQHKYAQELREKSMSKAEMDEQMEHLSKFVGEEIQRSIHSQKERIIRSIVRQAKKELKAKNNKKKDRDDRDRCEDDRDRCEDDRDRCEDDTSCARDDD